MKPIKNILNLSLGELLNELYADKNKIIAETDIYNHIRVITNDFEKEILDLLLSDLKTFCLNVVQIKYFGQKIKVWELMNFIANNEFLTEENMKGVELNREGLSFFDEPDYPIIYDAVDAIIELFPNREVDHDNVIGFINVSYYAKLVEKIYTEKYGKSELDETMRKIELKTSKKSRQILYNDLFKPKYQSKIDEFRKWLKREEYINDANEITASNYTNFARLFYLLRDNSIIKPNINNTKGITAYFKEFGVNVVETLNSLSETPEIARKTVTNENAKDVTQLGMTEKETTNLLNLFKNN